MRNQEEPMSTTESWHIEGEYFESCNCELLCPCLLSHAQARPTEGHCDVVLATHIARGSYGKVDLAGLNAVQALTTPGELSKAWSARAIRWSGSTTWAIRFRAGSPPPKPRRAASRTIRSRSTIRGATDISPQSTGPRARRAALPS